MADGSNKPVGSLNLDETAQGAVKTSSNLSGGKKFAMALSEGANAVGEIAGNLASVLPGGSAVLSAVSSGIGGVTGSGPFGGGSGSLGGLLGGGGWGGTMGGGGMGSMSSLLGGATGAIGGVAGGGGVAGAAGGANSGFQQQVQLLQMQQQMQTQSMVLTLISAILNIQHQTAQSIIQNIH